MVKTSSFRYDVAISFAGPDRTFAEELARHLASRGVRVFYDRYEEATLWGKNLYDHLQDIYQRLARYCLILVSKEYARRVWTSHERRAAQARAIKTKGEYLLPVMIDDTEIPGLPKTVAYVRVKEKTPEQIATLFLQKLSLDGRSGKLLNESIARARYAIGPTTLRFFDSREKDARPVCDLDVGTSVALVLEAIWAGDDIELWLGSTSQATQGSSIYYTFFENYAVKAPFAKKTDLDGLGQAMWLFELDVALIGDEKAPQCIAELIRSHNNEILRIRRRNMRNEPG
jgi:hypothetical protein